MRRYFTIFTGFVLCLSMSQGLAFAASNPGHSSVITPAQLRQRTGELKFAGLLKTAHPAVALRLSNTVSDKLGYRVDIAPQQIVQVTFASAGHQALKPLLTHTLGPGLYPSRRYGHSKLRIGEWITDAVPRGARPFPQNQQRSRVVLMESMHRRFYEAVFPGEPGAVKAAEQTARRITHDKAESGMGCSTFVTKILREHMAELRQFDPTARPYEGKIDSLLRSEGAAGKLWRKALAADPALVIVYTPAEDYRSITHPEFRFDYAL
jgi:hypothetical protein